MSNRSRPSPSSSNPFARPAPAADNPFASDDDEVLDEEEDEADVMARESVRMVQERLKAEQKSGRGAAAAHKHVKHTAPSFSDDEEEEEEDDEEVVEDEEEEEEDDNQKRKWVPDSSSPFARNVPAAGKAAAGKSKPAAAKASKAAAASNPFAEHSKSKSKNKKAGDGRGKAKAGKKEAAADTNPFADPEPAPVKKADSSSAAAPSSASASQSSASKDSKVETKPASAATSFLKRAAGAVGAAAVAAKTITAQTRQAKEAAAAASPPASPATPSVPAASSHKRQESNPFDEAEDHPPAAAPAPVKAKPAASTLAKPTTSALSTTKPSTSPTPSPVTHPASPPARSAVSATSSSSLSASSSQSAAAAPQSPPSLYIDSDTGDSDLSSLALPAASPNNSSLVSPTSVKRQAAYQQRLSAAVSAGTKMQLSAFKESWDAKVWTSELTQPLFTLIREKYPMDEAEERKLDEEEEEDESDEEDETGDDEDGVSEAERQAKRRQAQLKREGAGPRLRRRAFDSTPFNTLFSTSLARLNTLRDSLDASIAAANLATQKAEAEHTKRMSTFTSSLTSLTTRFGQLDSRISSVSHTAVRIGSSLESINASKVNTVKTLDLLTHFIAFNTGNAETLAPLFTSQKLNDMYEAASILQLLEGVSNEVRLAGVEKAVALIAKTSEECESRLLERFELALNRNNVEEMGSLARVLLGFKGKSVIKRYVFAAIQQIDRNRKRAADEDDVEGGEDDEDDDERDEEEDGGNEVAFIPSRRMTEDAPASPAVSAFRASLRIFYRIILTTVRQQCKTCAAVFPQPASIVRAIVERVYSDQVTEFIDNAVARGVSAEEELLMLASALHQTEKLTQHLQQVIKTLASHTFSTATTSSASSTVDVAALTDVMNGVFQKYRDAYVGKETSYLRNRCVGLINDTLASPPANDSITASLTSTASSAATDYLGLTKRAPTLSNRQRWLIDALDSEVVDELLKAMLVSVKRCDALSEAQTVADNQFALFSVILSALVDEFLHPLLSMIAQFLPAADPKSEPDSFIFVCVRLASSVAYRIRQHYVTFIQPRLSIAAAAAGSSSQNTQAISEQRLTESLSAIEQQLLSFLSRVLTAQLRTIQKLLARQKATDYKPKDEESLFSGKPTPTAMAIVDSLHAAYSAAINNLEGRNLDRYLTVLGLRVWEAVVEQLQRMSVSEMGAGLLSRDCKEYEAVVQEWHVREVVERFGVLRSVSNLFFVSVDNLGAWVEQEGKVRGMEREELMRFVRMRADYTQHKSKINAVLMM